MKKRSLISVLVVAVLLLVVSFLTNGCSTTEPTTSPAINPDPRIDANNISDGGGEPRSPGYWALWNTCAPENRAETAVNNGGSEAGWFLMDDLLADPGIQLGDFKILTCESGLALLEGHSIDNESITDPVYQLTSQLLAAELNLNIGAESCRVAEETVIGSHMILSSLGFDGLGGYELQLSGELRDTVTELIDRLIDYNSGQLCIN